MSAILSITSLQKTFIIHELNKQIKACRDVSLRLEEGMFAGITGKSGSGKSTILKMIYRSYLPEHGEILYDSKRFGPIDICTAAEREVIYLRKFEIGYVSQFLNVIPRSTAREVLEQSLLDIHAEKGFARDRANEMFEHFELEGELRDSFVSTFSGGEKLRLNIARAMVKHPRLLLLDEPTASLDLHSKGKVRMLIEQLKKEGTTMLGIFHDIDFMAGLCDREYAMADGLLSG
jgi:alpha-D-ribose 1-methylphosphonate 5-triphosphate synthase subunit PhnL